MQFRKSYQPAQTCALYESLESHNCAGQHVIADRGTNISATGILSYHFVFLNNQNFDIDQ